MCGEPPPPLLLKGIAQFNDGEYFEQHETLETLWRAEPRPVRRLYQGILQIGVAFHHVRRVNYHGAIYMLTRGPAYLEPFLPACQTVDVASLYAAALRARATIEDLGRARLHEFDWSLVPRVRLIPPAST
jgi:predicted metal-dependent hydrolase